MYTNQRLFLLTLLFALSTAQAGCGGSSSTAETSPVGPTTHVTRLAEVASSGTVSNSGFVGRGTDLAIGDSNLDESARGYYSFDLSSIDPQRVVSATLITRQFNMVGAPYPDLGPDVLVESVDIGSSLDAADFDTPGMPRGSLASDGNGGLSVDVTAAIKDLGFTSAQLTLRLAFPTLTDGNGDDDFINLIDPLNAASSGVFPHLSIVLRN